MIYIYLLGVFSFSLTAMINIEWQMPKKEDIPVFMFFTILWPAIMIISFFWIPYCCAATQDGSKLWLPKGMWR